MKYLKKFNENIVEWKSKDLDETFELLYDYVSHAEELTGTKNLAPEDAILILNKIGTEYSLELSKNIDEILDLIAEFDVESEIEQSKLN